ncbi:MAG: hypothetical protein Q9222_007083 [Ikaeria aurantiellina]
MQSPAHPQRNPSFQSPTAGPLTYAPPQPDQIVSMKQERERSLSVSPKTMLPSQLPLNSIGSALGGNRTYNAQTTATKRKIGDSGLDEPSLQQQPSPKRSMSLGVGGMLNASNEDDMSSQKNHANLQYNSFAQISPHKEGAKTETHRNSASGRTDGQFSSRQGEAAFQPPPPFRSLSQESSTISQIVQAQVSVEPSKQPSHASQIHPDPPLPQATSSKHDSFASEAASSMTQPSNTRLDRASQSSAPAPSPSTSKRSVPFREVPIFAQSYREHVRRGTLGNNRRQTRKVSPYVKQPPSDATSQMLVKQETNGHDIVKQEPTPSELDPAGLLGAWEPSITNVIPAEELTREISNYLFGIVQMNGVNFGPAGETSSSGANVEIEAKIGQIIDKNTNDRIRIPVLTECLLSHSDPNLRTAFRSSMTAAQHHALNKFLNQALQRSNAPPLPGEPPRKPRVPLTYVHKRETDTFYDLSPNALNALPPSIQAYLDRRNKPKVRITTDQVKNQVTAKIIKVRVSDIEVYSPQTLFDWRVSVSLELNYEGDLRDLVESSEGGKNSKRPDRNKDRVSYRHSHYQIDLTQVKPAEPTSKNDKEHELEIEIAPAAVREQGLLVKQGLPNKYEDLIKGFVDNVRVLARHCKEQ